jgi:serine/threonine protein kinase
MHMVAKVAHLDIKPENMIVSTSQTEGAVVIKLADFDTASLNPKPFRESKVIGTLPFIAPEVILDRICRPYAADIWSTGIVIVEVLCGMRTLERDLRLHPSESHVAQTGTSKQRRKKMAHIIREYFSQPESVARLLERNMRAEISRHFMCNEVSALLAGMINVDVDNRLRAEDVCNCSEEFFGARRSSDHL